MIKNVKKNIQLNIMIFGNNQDSSDSTSNTIFYLHVRNNI